jgi:hypothetical protein
MIASLTSGVRPCQFATSSRSATSSRHPSDRPIGQFPYPFFGKQVASFGTRVQFPPPPLRVACDSSQVTIFIEVTSQNCSRGKQVATRDLPLSWFTRGTLRTVEDRRRADRRRSDRRRDMLRGRDSGHSPPVPSGPSAGPRFLLGSRDDATQHAPYLNCGLARSRGGSARSFSIRVHAIQRPAAAGQAMRLHRRSAQTGSSAPIDRAGSPARRGWRLGKNKADRRMEKENPPNQSHRGPSRNAISLMAIVL